MILLDSRVGSKHLAPLIGPLATLTQLDSADAAFSAANGATIGIEIKTVGDAVNCMFSGRLVDRQVPLMREQYSECYLIIEGVYRPCPKSGVLQVAKGTLDSESRFGGNWVDATSGRSRLMAKSFEQWLSTLELIGGVRIRQTSGPAATATTIMSLYTWWGREDHSSFKVMQEPRGAAVELSRPRMLRRMAALLPGIGWVRSEAVAHRFKSIEHMINADEAEWEEIEGIGKTIAKNVREAIQNAKG